MRPRRQCAAVTQRPAPSSLELPAFGIIAGEVTLAATGGEARAPEWIRVTPRGKFATRDGRSYGFDPEVLAARFVSDAVDVAVDTNHGLALRATRGEDVEPIGYAAELQARPDGTWARVNWLDPATAAGVVRKHRYVSPTFFPDASGQAVWLHSISLVATPALSMPALLHALGGTLEPSMKQIAKALGLPEDATEAACLAAIGARAEVKPLAAALGLPETADAAACLAAIGGLRDGGGSLVTQLQGQLATTSAQLNALTKAARDKEVTDLLEGALKERRIVPAQRESLVTLCTSDEGLAGVKAMLAATAPNLQGSGLDGQQASTGGEVDPVTLAAKASKIQSERAAAGMPIGYAEAVQLAADAKA
ncbi:hypothetical protein OCOJLMKI_0522 [Methylobacterium iners]|uniref:Mu-like prophage I protein n=1 Tax=Methylobacterium iners TaxID=418707 RepID=A0ABQ4RUX2_9HYPH|nr:hypothetical protein OCOJLMKI_0522 [Methylobacterium iners]